MRILKFGSMLIATLVLFNTPASAVEFSECAKFLDTDKHKYLQCGRYSFQEATSKGEYTKVRQWLVSQKGESRSYYNELLTILMCDAGGQLEGAKAFTAAEQQGVIGLTNDLLNLGARFDSMPNSRIVTPLMCLSNRKNGAVLDYVLTRIKASKKDLDTSLYEGTDPARVPLFRAVMNNDMDSIKVLIKHGATPDFSVIDNKTALKTALELENLVVANWLLDIGASVHMGDEGGGCSGKSAIDYALEIPLHVDGREEVISRINELMSLPSGLKCQNG